MRSIDPMTRHYEELLASRYVWMLGGAELQHERSAQLAEQFSVEPRAGVRAMDLGGGPGFFAIALARRGFEVDLVDTSASLLERAREEAGELKVRPHLADLRSFVADASGRYEVIACLGDTLTHLPELDDVAALFRGAYERLESGGRLLLTFRDLSSPLEGLDRFIPVRADDERTFVCFLERGDGHVQVHDLVYECVDGTWQFHKSTYPKLIVPKDWAEAMLRDAGFAVEVETLPSGMLRYDATKPPA